MRISVSNIAWETQEDSAIADLLRRCSVDAIDIAPGKYFPSAETTTEADIAKVRSWWSDRGIAIVGMQSLLFGTTGLNLFGSSEIQAAMLSRLGAICRIAGALGATRLVFGSPKNRDRGNLSDEDTLNIACSFFQRLGELARNSGVTICLEPNPRRYGANFMIDSFETAKVVHATDHPHIGMQLDTGSLTINQEDPEKVLDLFSPLIAHIHASEPDLVPLGDGGCDHSQVAKHVSRRLAGKIVCIEMIATKEEPHLVSVERALKVAIHAYRGGAGKYGFGK